MKGLLETLRRATLSLFQIDVTMALSHLDPVRPSAFYAINVTMSWDQL